MQLIDYTGKLNEHEKYLKIISLLEEKSKFMEYILIYDGDTKLIDKFSSEIISVRFKNKWWGTKSSKSVKIYRFRVNEEIFNYLKKFETFCKYVVSNNGDYVIETNFGINDITFYDDEDLPLLFTTTHEGYIMIRDDLLK